MRTFKRGGLQLKRAGVLDVTRLLALVIVVSCSCMLAWLSFVVLLCASRSMFSFIISHHTSIHSSSSFDEETTCLYGMMLV